MIKYSYEGRLEFAGVTTNLPCPRLKCCRRKLRSFCKLFDVMTPASPRFYDRVNVKILPGYCRVSNNNVVAVAQQNESPPNECFM